MAKPLNSCLAHLLLSLSKVASTSRKTQADTTPAAFHANLLPILMNHLIIKKYFLGDLVM